jgi:hypothetical protein
MTGGEEEKNDKIKRMTTIFFCRKKYSNAQNQAAKNYVTSIWSLRLT